MHPERLPVRLVSTDRTAGAEQIECRACGHWKHRHQDAECTVVAGTADGLGDSPCGCAQFVPMLTSSVRATYNSVESGPQFHVTTYVGDRNVSFQEPIADPFVRSTVHVGWWDVLRQLARHRSVRVTVVVGGTRERVHDVLELDDQTLIPGRSRHAAFQSAINARLGSM